MLLRLFQYTPAFTKSSASGMFIELITFALRWALPAGLGARLELAAADVRQVRNQRRQRHPPAHLVELAA